MTSTHNVPQANLPAPSKWLLETLVWAVSLSALGTMVGLVFAVLGSHGPDSFDFIARILLGPLLVHDLLPTTSKQLLVSGGLLFLYYMTGAALLRYVHLAMRHGTLLPFRAGMDSSRPGVAPDGTRRLRWR